MPLYEYRCAKCGALVEKIQKFSDKSLAKCVKCGGQLERLLSAPAIQFKGRGWYITDYARKSSGEAPKSDGSSSGKSDGASSEAKKSATPAATKSGDITPAAKK